MKNNSSDFTSFSGLTRESTDLDMMKIPNKLITQIMDPRVKHEDDKLKGYN